MDQSEAQSSSSSSSTNTEMCNRISASSNISLTSDDIIYKGQVKNRWALHPMDSQHAYEGMFVGPFQTIDYVYFIIDDQEKGDILTEDNFILKHSHPVMANSKFKLKAEQTFKQNQYQYVVEIYYECVGFGGSILEYQLSVSIPGKCENLTIYWTKLCGNPLRPREGFSVDLTYVDTSPSREYNKTIVRNGLLKDDVSTYFDADVKADVFRIPYSQKEACFFLYMNKDDIKKARESLTQENLNKEGFSIYNFDIFAAAMEAPTTRVSQPKFNTDESILSVRLSGEATNAFGVDITEEPKGITIDFKCKGYKGDAIVELNIFLDFFKDISIFFVKECEGIQMEVKGSKSGGFFHFLYSLIIYSILIITVYCFIGTIYNIIVEGKQFAYAMPYAAFIINYLAELRILQNTMIGEQIQNINTQIYGNTIMKVSGVDQEEENEFKIENLSEIQQNTDVKVQYGSV